MTQAPQVQTGSIVENTYMVRSMAVYGMHEGEVEMMTQLNAQSTMQFSCASAFASLAVGIWISAAFSSEVPAAGQILATVVAPAFTVVAMIFAGFAIWSLRTRSSTLQRVREQSRVATSTPAN